MRIKREKEYIRAEIELRGRRRKKDQANSLRFLVCVEGVEDHGRVRSANGMKWKVA